MSDTLLAVLIGGVFGFLGALIGIVANIWLESRKANNERLKEVRRRLVGDRIQTTEVLDFMLSRRKRKWPRFWERDLPDLSRGNLREIDLRRKNLRGVNFFRADLTESDLDGSDLTNTDLGKVILVKADLSNADLSGADLRGADLSEAVLDWAHLRGAKIDHTTRIGDKWRLVWEIVNYGPGGRDLSGADLRYAHLAGADLRWAYLTEAYLEGANLYKADLTGSDLTGSDLTGAGLYEADLTEADLTGAGLTYEQLAEARSLADTIMPDGQKYDPTIHKLRSENSP